MKTFKPATGFTQNIFNPHGLKNYDAVRECEMRENGYASYDLTVLDCNGHYKCAHGSVIEPFLFSTVKDAENWLFAWYEQNKQKKAVTA